MLFLFFFASLVLCTSLRLEEITGQIELPQAWHRRYFRVVADSLAEKTPEPRVQTVLCLPHSPR